LAPDRSRIIAFSKTCAKDDYSDEVRAAFSNNPVTCYIATREKEIMQELGYAYAIIGWPVKSAVDFYKKCVGTVMIDEKSSGVP